MNIDKAENERLNRKLRDIVTGKYQSPVTQRNNFFSTNLDNVHNNEENAIGIQNGTKDSEGVAHYTLAQNTPAYLPGAEKLFTVRNNIIQNQVEAINKQTAQNEYYAQKYKDTPKTYEGYMSHAEHVSDEERKWLEEQASQYATTEDYKKEAEKAQGEYNYLRRLGEVNTEKAMALKDNHRSSPLLEDTRKITGLINNAQGDVLKNESNARTAKVKNNNEYYAEKYKDTPKTFEAYMNHAEHVSDEERQWLESQAEEFATPEDYRKQAEKAQGELNYLNRLSHVTGLKAEITGEESAYNSDVQNRIESADTKIKEYKDKAEQKEYEEKTKDILEGDARVRSIVQQYYAYQKNSEQRKSGNDEAVRIDSETSNKQYTPEQEKRIVENFNNLANEGYDPKALYTYYDRAMQEQASIENLQKIQQDAMNNPVGASAWSVLDNAVGSVGDAFKYIGAGIAEDITGEKQWINTYDTAAARVGTVRSTVSDIIGADIGNETAGKLASFLYQTGMSLADFAATLPLELVPGIGTGLQLALMSTEAGASAAKDAYDNTSSAENALGTGIMAGIAESFFEKFSIENLKAFESVSPDSVKSILKNAGKQMITEASEEGLTTIANTLTDYIINGDMSAIAREYQGYIDEGYTQEEANAKCAESFAKQVGLDAAGGAVSGLALGGGVSAVSYAKGKFNANYDLKKSAEELGKEAMASKDFDIKLLLQEAKDSGNEKAISIANAVEKKINGNKSYKVNSVDVGNLMKLIGAESFEGAISKDAGENADTENEAATNENIKALSKEEIAEHITYNFGNSHKNGIIADDRKGHSVVVKGFESSTRSIGEADNKVRVITEDGKVYNADDLLFSSPEYNRLMNAAKNFDTNGAGVLLQEYGDYVEFKGKVTDINERINDYVNSFSELYEAGKMGGSYERVASSKYFGKYIDAIGPQRAIKAVEAGNKDSELFFNNEEKLVRIDRSANVKANVYVEKSAEEMVNLDEGKRLALENLSKMTGKEIVLTGDMDENGRIDFREGKIYIRASLDGNYILPVAMHETMHSFRRESPTDYRLIRNFVVDYLFASGKDVMKMVEDVKLDYGDRVTSNEDCIEEIVCNSIMAIAGDEGAMGKALQVAKAEKGVLKKLSEAIKSLASKIKEFILTHTTNKAAQAFAEDVKALDRLAEMFSNAADNIKAKSEEVITSEQKNNTAEGVGNVKYSIGYTTDNKPVVIIEDDILKGVEKSDWVQTVKNTISDKFTKGIPIKGRFIKVNKKTKNEYTKSKYSQKLSVINNVTYEDKFRTANNLDEVIIASTNYVNEDLKHTRKDSFKEFARGDVLIRVGSNDYSAKVIVGFTKGNEMVLYDIVDFTPKNFDIKKVGVQYRSVANTATNSRLNTPTTINISQSSKNVNTKNDENSKNKKYAVDDIVDENRDKTDGKEFIRWFGDWQNEPQSASKVVDSNGEPLVVYHQTENDFNVFDTNKKGAGEFDSEMPTGIFMKPTNSNIGLSGNKQMALYANIRNPLTVNNRAELVKFYEQNIDGYKEARDYISSIDSEYKQKYEQAEAEEDAEYSKLWTAREQGKITEDEYQKAIESNALDELEEEWHNKVNEASKKAKSLIDDYFRNSNYDGVIVNNDVGSFGRSTKTYIAFSNTQVKSATDNIGTFDGSNSDIRYAMDDTLNDWLDDESTPQGIDYEKAVEKNPVVAVAKIYNSASKTAESGLRQGKSVKLEESDYKRIANRIMQNYGIKGKHNPNYKAELTTQIAQFVENTSKKNANFTELFEGLVENCKSGILLSGDYDTETLKTEREYIFGLMRDNTLLIKPRDVEQIEEDYGSVANYRKKMFGKTRVAVGYHSNNNSYFIEDIITHVEDWFPYLIDENADGDMGYLWLENLVNNVLKPKYKNPYFEGENSFYETPETAAIQMAFDCTTQIINAKAEKLKADNRADKKVLRDLQTQQKEANRQVKDLVEAKTNQYKHELAEAKKRNIELWKKNAELRQEAKEEYRKRVEHSRKMFARYNKALEKLRVERNKNIYRNKQIEAHKAIIASHYKTIREEYNENREKTLYLNKLGTMCDRLTKRLNGKAKNNEYIPDSLKGPIIDVLSCFTVKDAKGATPEYFGEWNRLKEIGQRVADLESAYRKLNGNQKKDTKDVPSSFIDIESIHYKVDVMNQLEKLKELVEGHNIYTLTSNELVAIYDTMQMLDQSLRDAVQIIVNGKKVNFMELSEKAINEVKTNKPATDYSKTKNVVLAPVKQLGKSYISTHLDPVRYGRMLSNYHDDSIINELFSGLHAGENKAIAIQHRAISRIKEVTTKYANEIKNIQNEDVKEFDFYDVVTGRRVPITKGELLAIYLTDRQKSGHIHLLGGTEESYINNAKHFTVLPNLELNNKKQKRTAKENLHKVRFGIDDLKQIERYVQNDKVLMELAEAISEVYNQTLKQEINEVSMAKYGMKIATVKNYYPIKVYGDGGKYEKNLDAEFYDTRLKSRGFTKQRQWSATPIVIDDVLRNFVRQVRTVSEYCGMLIPIENFKKVYNYSDGTQTLHSTILERYGATAEHYIDKLIGDLQQRADTTDKTVLEKMQSNFMEMKIAFNLGSMVKQAAAFPLANRYFGTKNVTRAISGLVQNKVDFDLYSQYTAYLWYRKEGNGTVIGELSKKMSLTKKGQDLFDFVGKMDNRVIASLLYAAELHVEQTTNLKKGTDAFYKEVARQFEKCIDETQPNNMVTSKPQYLRNKTLRLLSLNAFRSQNMAIGNTILDSFLEMKARMNDYKSNPTAEAKSARKDAILKFVSCCAGAINSSLLLGALSLASSIFIYHRWDDLFDDEGNVSAKKFGLSYINEVLNGLFSSFAMGDYMYDAVSSAIDKDKTFYGLQVMSIDSINDMISDITKGNYWELGKILGDCFGVPITNVTRLGTSVFAYGKDLSNGNGRIITDNKGNVNTDYLHYYIVEDKKNGNDTRAEHYESMWKEILMTEEGKSESEATAYIKNKLVTALSADENVEDAGVAKVNGNLADYEKYRQNAIDYGFDSKDVQKAIDRFILGEAKLVSETEGYEERKQELLDNGYNEKGADYVIGKIDESDSSDEGGTSVFADTSEDNELVMYSYNDMFDALVNGDTENYETIEKYMTTKGGKTEKEITSAMTSASRTDRLWAEYIEASTGNNSQRTRELAGQLTRIYGSWDKAKVALRRYRNRHKDE